MKREEAARLLRMAVPITALTQQEFMRFIQAVNMGIEALEQPEIIRCRECKFASGDSRICMKFDHSPIGELDFCAWAERRTNG